LQNWFTFGSFLLGAATRVRSEFLGICKLEIFVFS
jgi:hypothetical protein